MRRLLIQRWLLALSRPSPQVSARCPDRPAVITPHERTLCTTECAIRQITTRSAQLRTRNSRKQTVVQHSAHERARSSPAQQHRTSPALADPLAAQLPHFLKWLTRRWWRRTTKAPALIPPHKPAKA